jgi:chromosome segregation ATPase
MLNNQYEDLKNQHDNAVKVIKTEKEKYTVLKNESDRLHSQYESLQSKTNEIELKNITLKSDNSILSAKINHADENIREFKNQIDDLQTVSVSLKNKVESLEHSLSQKELSNQRHEDKIQELTIELKQTYNELNKLKAMNLSITNEKSNLASQFQLLESVIDKLSEKKTKT